VESIGSSTQQPRLKSRVKALKRACKIQRLYLALLLRTLTNLLSAPPLILSSRAGKHDGWEETAWLGLEMSIEELAKRKVKVVINGGCLNPAGLAAKVANLV
jgi:hypothetical protein